MIVLIDQHALFREPNQSQPAVQRSTQFTRTCSYSLFILYYHSLLFFFFFFTDTATTEIYTLSLHDALPISPLFTILGQEISGRDLILLGGGLFLLAKATHEIHDKLEGEQGDDIKRVAPSLTSVIVQISLLDKIGRAHV